MDILASIEDQVKEIRKLSTTASVDQIITHIKRAEHYYSLGIKNKDENYFTDVVYRTNQAFEGSLRQSYMILADKTEEETAKKRTVDIESFLSANSIFNQRVLDLFSNYRKNWRNQSTHDFKLFFSESEALLAIVNVSAYIYVLFNQIIGKLAYLKEEETIRKSHLIKKAFVSRINKQKNLFDKITECIRAFTKITKLNADARDIEIIGAFYAFLESIFGNKITVERGTMVSKGFQSGFLDMYIKMGNERLIIEVKRPGTAVSEGQINQILSYLMLTDESYAILWVPDFSSGKIEVKNEVIDSPVGPNNIRVIT